jgi:ryanodine receptor 2
LVPLEDLQGVLSLRFTLHTPAAGENHPESDMPTGLIPGHKQSVVLFLERVYGIETQELFFKLLEDAFLPDLRTATMLDKVEMLNLSVLVSPCSCDFYSILQN